MTGAVLVWNSSTVARNIPRDIADCIAGDLQVFHIKDPMQWPRQGKADFYIYRTDLTTEVERAAGRMDSGPGKVCWPVYLGRKRTSASEWLTAQINARCRAGEDVLIFSASKVGGGW